MKKLIEIIPDPAEIYYSLASSYESLKLYDSAINVLKEYQKIQPQNKQIDLQIARLLSLKNKPPEVIADSNVKKGSGKKM
jgi:tetratricopeptide (TPR) repeat protein